MINISEYLTTQTPLPPFLPYPRFLLELDLSQTAKMTYVLLLDRATLSQKNLWIDERGYSFTFNPSLLTIPKRKQQVAEILKEAETYIWRIKEEMRCA